MKIINRIFVLLVVIATSYGALNARVYMCKDGGEPCERIDRVRINGEWMEATCENVRVPEGWYIELGDGC
jgi:hypothetical protein